MIKFLVSLLLVLLAGCASVFKPLPVVDVERFSIQNVSHIGTAGPMAISADGRLAAWGDGGLQLLDIEAKHQVQLLEDVPETLCWSPDGVQLAVTTRVGAVSKLTVFDRSGVNVYEQDLNGLVGRLQWPLVGGLTAGVLRYESYRFGTHIAQRLLRWDAGWLMTEVPLYETTIMPSTAATLNGRLAETFDFDLSPLGDEVLYTRLHAPPAFAASRHLVLFNLQTRQERQVAALPLLNGAGRLTADGEFALISEGIGQVRRQDMWSNGSSDSWAGEYSDYDASSGLLLAGHQLLQDHLLLLELPPKSQTQISFGGKFLLINWDKRLYRLTGYPVSQNEPNDEVSMTKLKKLRRLRSRGLIELNEYQQSKARLLQ